MINILIVDDQAAVRKGLKMQLSLEADLLVVGEVENGSRALEVIPSLKPDVVILDLEMPVMDGLSTLEFLRIEHPEIPVIMLSIHDCLDDRFQAEVHHGGHGYHLAFSQVFVHVDGGHGSIVIDRFTRDVDAVVFPFTESQISARIT